MQMVTPSHVGQNIGVLVGGHVYVGHVDPRTNMATAVITTETHEHMIAQKSIAAVTRDLVGGTPDEVDASIRELLARGRGHAEQLAAAL